MSNCPTCGHHILDPEPPEGSVVLDDDGDAWQHIETDGAWTCVARGTDYELRTWAWLSENHGPISVIHLADAA